MDSSHSMVTDARQWTARVAIAVLLLSACLSTCLGFHVSTRLQELASDREGHPALPLQSKEAEATLQFEYEPPREGGFQRHSSSWIPGGTEPKWLTSKRSRL